MKNKKLKICRSCLQQLKKIVMSRTMNFYANSYFDENNSTNESYGEVYPAC